MSEQTKLARAVPWALVIAFLSLMAASGLMVLAIYILAGMGWAILFAAVPFLTLSAVIFRGLNG